MRARRSKYGNVKTAVNGETFDSRKEAKRWGELQLLQRAIHIRNLRRQVRFRLEVGGVKIADYVADFVYDEAGPYTSDEWFEVVEDVKSPATRRLAAYRMKHKLMRAIHGITITEV